MKELKIDVVVYLSSKNEKFASVIDKELYLGNWYGDPTVFTRRVLINDVEAVLGASADYDHRTECIPIASYQKVMDGLCQKYGSNLRDWYQALESVLSSDNEAIEDCVGYSEMLPSAFTIEVEIDPDPLELGEDIIMVGCNGDAEFHGVPFTEGKDAIITWLNSEIRQQCGID